MDGVLTNKVIVRMRIDAQILLLTYGDGEKEVDLNSLSNSKLTEEDFNSFLSEREHHQQPVMTKSVLIPEFHHRPGMQEAQRRDEGAGDEGADGEGPGGAAGASPTDGGRPQDQHDSSAGRPATEEGPVGDGAEERGGGRGERE